MNSKQRKYLKIASEVLADVFVGALVFYVIHIVFMQPLIWIGIVFILSVCMRTGAMNKPRKEVESERL